VDTFEGKYEQIISEIQASPYLCQLEKIKSVSANRPIILYGAGEVVGIVLAVCKNSGLNITALCDSKKRGMYERAGVTLPIITPHQLIEYYSNSSLIVTSWKFESEIRKSLKSIGFNDENIFSFWYLQRITPEIFNNYLDGYKWAYDFYEDEISKQLVIDKMKAYLVSAPLKPNTGKKMYYEKVIQFDENEVYLEGAYDEDGIQNIKQFINKVNGKYKYIYIFQPEKKPFENLQKYSQKHNDIEVFNAGLCAENGSKTFYYDGLVASGFVLCEYFATAGSKFSDTEFKTEDKKVLSIDTMIRDGRIKHMPTFIKLDIEGSEADALKGAAYLIQNYKPKLAVCVYHQVQDIYEIPKVILDIRNDYKFILRQHDHGYYETVLYAY